MLASLDVLVFLKPWTLTVRCICGRERAASLPDLARTGLRDREHRALGKLVQRLRCQDCGQRPASVIAEYAPSREREELIVGSDGLSHFHAPQTNAALHIAATGAALGHPVSRVWKGYWQR